MKKPNPGSEEAQAQGCTCPIIDNHYGKGIPTKDGPIFWYFSGCPVHDEEATGEVSKETSLEHRASK